MSLRELLLSLYLWADANAMAILLASLIWAAGGSLLALIGRGGRTDSDGRAIAGVVIGGAVLFLVFAVTALGIAHAGFKKSLFDANVLLLSAPLICLAGSVAGIHWVFPLSELATVRTMRDIGLFLLACAAALWLLSTFRGWGVVFLGGIGDLLVIGVLAAALLRVLFRRAFQQQGGVHNRSAEFLRHERH